VITLKVNFTSLLLNNLKYIDENGILSIPADPLVLWEKKEFVCPTGSSAGPIFPTKYSQTGNKGWYLLFMPGPGESGFPIYNQLALYYDDEISPINTTYASLRYIRVDPVNDAPVISIKGPEGDAEKLSYDKQLFILDPVNYKGNDIHVDGKITLSAVAGIRQPLGLTVTDEDSGTAALTIDIQLSSSKKGEFSYTLDGKSNKGKSINTKLSVAQAKSFFDSLSLDATEKGEFTVTVTVNDNGFGFGTCPPGPNFKPSIKKCERISVATIKYQVDNNNALIAGVTTGVGAGVLALAALGALLGGKFLKPKETDAWAEWDDDKLGDVALQNPFYQQQTSVNTSGIYNGN